MDAKYARPFDSIESAHEFVVFLAQRVEEAITEVQGHSDRARAERNERRVQALAVALLKMNQLSTHMQKSRRILNDLRSLRRLLFQERDPRL
jgi:phospholipid N-methyltransferase